MPAVNTAMVSVRIWLEGEKIHGINLRLSIKKIADKHGVSGFVRNRFEPASKTDDKLQKVEVALEGERQAVMEVRGWIELGKIGKVKNLTRFKRYSFKWQPFRNQFKGREFEIV